NACTKISFAKSKTNNFAKSEEVKSLQSVINLLAPGYSDKNNRSDSYVKSGGEKN
ncbi:10327_t:CDS:1, partial [Gigaspora rosea]